MTEIFDALPKWMQIGLSLIGYLAVATFAGKLTMKLYGRLAAEAREKGKFIELVSVVIAVLAFVVALSALVGGDAKTDALNARVNALEEKAKAASPAPAAPTAKTSTAPKP